MKNFAAASAALLATTAIASAEISRTDPSVRLLFESVGPSGNFVELSYGFVNPNADSGGTVPNPLASYNLLGAGFLHRYNDQLSVGMTYDTPFGADVSYPGFGAGLAGAPFFGGNATVETRQLTLLGRYNFGNGFSVHGGLRALESEGSIYTAVAPPLYHQISGSSDVGYGYLVGAAYEVPEIALRVALTYNSALQVDFRNVPETPFVPTTGAPAGATTSTSFSVEFPESLNLEFQTGIAEGTLAFGSIHYEHWDGFSLATGVGSYVNFTSDTTTYQVGLGRQFNDDWAGTIAYTHRTRGTVPSDSALAPTTGLNTLTVGARYTMDAITISGGITYGLPGDQTVPTPFGDVNFNDNDVFGLGLRVGFRF